MDEFFCIPYGAFCIVFVGVVNRKVMHKHNIFIINVILCNKCHFFF
nr:MAG TPA: hypothetical protein [Caudoviricetes sp.]